MSSYIIMLLIGMLCFSGCHCGQGTVKYPEVTDPKKPGYCGKYSCSPDNCPKNFCYCKSSMSGFFYTEKTCTPLGLI
ncbi:hypothetical protein MTO96_040892 [Rhipicephalus appendiculatus]